MSMTESVLSLILTLWGASTCLAQSEAEKSPSPTPVTSPCLEAVRSAYREGKDKEVLILAERALIDATTVGDPTLKAAELYFWKGSALRRLGRLDEALIALDHARALGFTGPELYLEHGLANKGLGNAAESQQDYQEAEKRFPEDPEERELYLKHWKWDANDQPRFQLWVAPQAGWDSNVIGLDPSTPLFQNKVTFDSYYAGAYVDTKFYVVQNQHQLLWVEYQLLGRDYPQEQDVSFLDNVMSIAGRQPLLENVDFELRGTWEEAFLNDSGHFRTQRTIGPAFLYQPTAGLQVRFWGDWTDATYYESVPAPQDRDGTLTRVGLTFAVDLGQAWALGPYGYYDKSNTKGTDYDSAGWDLGIQVTSPEMSGLKAILVVNYGQESFTNPNSLTDFTTKRKDQPFGFTLTVTLKVIEQWLGYAPSLSVGYVHHASNISDFNYNRWTPQLEVSLGVLSF